MAAHTNIMQPALSGEAMREADRYTIEEIGIPGFTLMESAGRTATQAILDRYGPIEGKHVGQHGTVGLGERDGAWSRLRCR